MKFLIEKWRYKKEGTSGEKYKESRLFEAFEAFYLVYIVGNVIGFSTKINNG